MAGVSEKVVLTGELDEFKDSLHRLRRFDWRGLHVALAHAMRNSTLQRFARAVGPDGTPWKSSKRVEAAKRAKKRRKTLVATGDLRRSIATQAWSDYAAVGTNLVYARIHQLGGEAGPKARRVTIPARPFLGLSAEDDRLIGEMTRRALSQELAKGGGL